MGTLKVTTALEYERECRAATGTHSPHPHTRTLRAARCARSARAASVDVWKPCVTGSASRAGPERPARLRWDTSRAPCCPPTRTSGRKRNGAPSTISQHVGAPPTKSAERKPCGHPTDVLGLINTGERRRARPRDARKTE